MTTSVPVTTATPAQPPPVGSLIYVASYLLQLALSAEITPPDTPNLYSGEFEVLDDHGNVDLTPLMGPRGFPGNAQFGLRRQIDPLVRSTADLPSDLTDTPTDIGKYWPIATFDFEGVITGVTSWAWMGTSWRAFQMGTQGPPGPAPGIQPDVTLIPPQDYPPYPDTTSYITTEGPSLTPSWNFGLAVPRGKPGPISPLYTFPDVDLQGTPPQIGDLLGHSGKFNQRGEAIWVPISRKQFATQYFSMPESAFSPYTGVAQQAPIGSFVVPPQPWPWTPIVWGHVGAAGATLSTNLMIGVQVLLGDPAVGTQIARGMGSTLGEVNVMPHYSTSEKLSQAITPFNNFAIVPANHTDPSQGTVYINLWNDGQLGVYDFQPESVGYTGSWTPTPPSLNAQLFLLIVPMEKETVPRPLPPATPSPVTVVQTTSNVLDGLFPAPITAGNAVVVIAGGWCSTANKEVTIPTPTIDHIAPQNTFAVFNDGSTNCLQSPGGTGWAGGYWISMWVLPDTYGGNGVEVTTDGSSDVGLWAWSALEVSGLGARPYVDAESRSVGGTASVAYSSGQTGSTRVNNELVIAAVASGAGASLPGSPWITVNDLYGGVGYQVQSTSSHRYLFADNLNTPDSWVAAAACIAAAPPRRAASRRRRR